MTTFLWPHDAHSVSIVGSFNHWQPQPMMKDHDAFQITVHLEPGQYQYKFILDGRRWCYDLDQPTITDEKGNRNNVITVGTTSGDDEPKHHQHEEKVEVVMEEVSEPIHKGQEHHQKGQEQHQKGQEQQKGQGQQQKGQGQQQKGQGPSKVARVESQKLVKTVKSYGVPFYVGDVECEDEVQDVVGTAQLFQKALPDIGCMLVSAGLTKFIVVAVVPPEKSSVMSALECVNEALSIHPNTTGTGNETFAQGEIQANPDAGVFPLKLKDLCRGPVFILLRKRGLVKEEESEDEMYFFDE